MTTAEATAETTPKREFASRIERVKLGDLRPAPLAQRAFKPAWARELLGRFKLEGMGFPVVNKRDDRFYIVDGQHRIWCLKELGFEDQDTIECELFTGMSEQEECELFLERNFSKAVGALEKFRTSVNAGRVEEGQIDSILATQDLHIGPKAHGGISSVASVQKAYRRQGAQGLAYTMIVIRDAFGDAGFDRHVIDGISLFLTRYGDQIDIEKLVARLAEVHGGVAGLLGEASKVREQLRQPKSQCVAATVQKYYNRGGGAGRIAAWWRE